MFIFFVCICILGYAIYLYDKGQKDKSTFFFFFLLCDGFDFLHLNWLSGMPINKYKDFALIYLIYTTVCHLSKSRKNNLVKFPVYKFFSFLVIYLTAEFLFTVLIGKESLNLSLAVYRNYLFFLSFILFQELNKKQLKNVIINVSIASVIEALVYVTQPIHNLPILDGAVVSDINIGLQGARYRNIPELLYYVLIYITVRLDFSKYKSLFIISLCCLSLVLTQHRGVMLGYAGIVVLYLFLSRNVKKFFQYGIVCIVVFFTVGSMVISRFENKGHTNTFDDIANVVNMDYTHAAASGYDDEGGTFTFRVLLFIERFDYFKSNPQYMLTGVGMRHEDSPNTQKDFNFVLGSRKQDKASGYWIPQQIDSGDLVWFTPFIKFGIIGLFLYIYIACMIVVFLFKNRYKGTIAMVTFLFYVFLIIISMKNNMLFAPIQVSFLLMLIELVRRTKTHNIIDKIKYQDFDLLGKKFLVFKR